MKLFLVLFAFFYSILSYGQSSLPFYYEQNLPLYGKPTGVAEYYYEYYTQAKAHYYNHTMEYDSYGRIKTHIKSNSGLLNLDSIPLPFHTIIDLRPVTITYSFSYDTHNRLIYFVRNQYQEEVGVYQQDEEWEYDDKGMLMEHNFWEITSTDTILKNPSTQRTVYRDSAGKVLKIEKQNYSFSNKGLALNESTEFSYRSNLLDTIFIYGENSGTRTLKEKRYNILFQNYDPLNTDSILYHSYTSMDQLGQITGYSFSYDTLERKLRSATTDISNDTLTKSEWVYEPFKTTERRDDYYSMETYYDETGYERYREEFDNGYSLAVPADLNTRTIENGRIKNALLEIWDPVTLFYRKDTEYTFDYNKVAGIGIRPKPLREIRVYPNPSAGTIYLENTEDIVRLELISSEGKSTILPVSPILTLNVPTGLYILCTYFRNDSSQRTKIVVAD
jgi:hypothetical protein